MISQEDMQALAPETRALDTNRKDWREHLRKIIKLADTGTRVVYWIGPTDVLPTGNRKEVFEEVASYGKRVHLFQDRVDGGYKYMLEVR